ncbi:plasmid mobilization relaxosome protein MobC [Vibrio aestuarianus]|uniref:plasmid mobilization relaxosome protein MobC n=1 Tax=Vibrio aestuarianus TaxID=28171 RepID=UPI001594DF58|nr:plasmid mobilization relaxosome protein MobC [Vibrio aestuarianus]MDE1235120.1 MobC family plasmid mobilization relaxosome protein [Vibrio aestuarianus]MDE1245997.1 MobC family plasmid mobilization relaxosome protein [Vibrio aestuarianus]NGZ63214.1 MobC family plasmid mobilization relaxosome protein [Vibrio aestuarianus subsp. cardii]
MDKSKRDYKKESELRKSNPKNRNKKIIIRVSEKEKAALESFKDVNGYKSWLEMLEANKTDLPKIFGLDKQTISTINNLHQIGNNINQIAKYMNSMNELTEEQFKRYLSLVSNLAKLKKELKKKFDI